MLGVWGGPTQHLSLAFGAAVVTEKTGWFTVYIVNMHWAKALYSAA